VSLVCDPESLRRTLARIRMPDDETTERLHVWTEVLDRWCRVQRLVGWRSWRDLLDQGIADAWAALPLVEQVPDRPVLDLGSGAGLPGLILAAALPDRPFCLVEARRKRASFLREAVRVMGLPRVRVLHGRSEQLRGEPGLPVRPLLMARAFAPPAEVLAEADRWETDRCLLSLSPPVPAHGDWRELGRADGRPEGRLHLLFARN
jgi:16S rRNA G527 N7-methylase RsmG